MPVPNAWKSHKRFLVLLALMSAATVGLVPTDGFASGMRIDDRASVITPEARNQIQAVGNRLLSKRNVPIMVLTLESVGVNEALFGRGDGAAVSLDRPGWELGIMIAWARSENLAVVHTGPGWTAEDKKKLVNATNRAVIPHFSQNNPSRGLSVAVTTWERVVKRVLVPSYWDRFISLEKTAVDGLVDRFRKPTWKTLLWFVPTAAVPWIVLEFILPWRKKQRHLRGGIGLDLFYTILHKPLFFAFIGAAVCGVTSFAFNDLLLRHFGIENIVAVRFDSLPPWLRNVVALLTLDFGSYLVHRLLHRVDFLWEFHKVHHSATELDVFNAIRQHFVEVLVYRFVPFVPLGLIGFGAIDAFYINLSITVLSYYTHSNTKLPLGPLKYVFNNPQLHVWHHTVEIHDRGNVNFGDALSIWDFIFGTGYAPDERHDLELGFDGIETYPQGFWGQVVEPFKGCYELLKRK